jgi:hypothetical protein
MKLFEITVAGRRFAVAREADGDQFYQTYYVDGRDVPVQHYLKMMPWPWGPTLVPCSTARARSGTQWFTALAPPESRPTSTARQTRAAAMGRPVPAVSARFATSAARRRVLLWRGPRDHHFCRFDHREGIVAAPQVQRPDRVSGDDGRQGLISHTQPNLGQQPIDPNLVDESVQAIPGAQARERLVVAPAGHGRDVRSMVCRQAVELRFRHSMVPAFRADRPHPS